MTHDMTHHTTPDGTREVGRPIDHSARRRGPDEDRARSWLRSQLEWEEILAALRDATGRSTRRRPPGREPAAA